MGLKICLIPLTSVSQEGNNISHCSECVKYECGLFSHPHLYLTRRTKKRIDAIDWVKKWYMRIYKTWYYNGFTYSLSSRVVENALMSCTKFPIRTGPSRELTQALSLREEARPCPENLDKDEYIYTYSRSHHTVSA